MAFNPEDQKEYTRIALIAIALLIVALIFV